MPRVYHIGDFKTELNNTSVRALAPGDEHPPPMSPSTSRCVARNSSPTDSNSKPSFKHSLCPTDSSYEEPDDISPAKKSRMRRFRRNKAFLLRGYTTPFDLQDSSDEDEKTFARRTCSVIHYAPRSASPPASSLQHNNNPPPSSTRTNCIPPSYSPASSTTSSSLPPSYHLSCSPLPNTDPWLNHYDYNLIDPTISDPLDEHQISSYAYSPASPDNPIDGTCIETITISDSDDEEIYEIPSGQTFKSRYDILY